MVESALASLRRSRLDKEQRAKEARVAEGGARERRSARDDRRTRGDDARCDCELARALSKKGVQNVPNAGSSLDVVLIECLNSFVEKGCPKR